MKKFILSLLSTLTFIYVSSAQVPQAINYQAVVRNNTGDVIKNQPVRFRLSITEGLNGATVYSETQLVTTNLLGLVNLGIGTGTVVTGSLPSVVWSTGQKYLKVEIDVSGGSNYILMGTQSFLTVPYAFHSEKSNIANIVANQWQFNTNGIHYNSGRVGIGTATPNFGLHIERDGDGLSSSIFDQRSLLYLVNTSTNTASNTNIKVASVGTSSTTNITNFPPNYSIVSGYANYGMLSNTGAGLILQAQQQIRLKTGANTDERMIINSDGNIGVGTINPSAQFHTTGSVKFQGLTQNNTLTRILAADNSGSLSWRDVNSIRDSISNKWLNNSNGINYNQGLVGVGNITPNFALHIERDGDGYSNSIYDQRSLLYLLNTSANAASNTNIKVASMGTNSTTNITNFPSNYSIVAGYANYGMLSNTGAGLILQAQQQIRFKTGANTDERMVINSDGNIGIGTITPKSKVEVTNGDVYINDTTKGIILKSPNGNCWRVTIDNTGNFVRTAIACPN